MGSLILSTFLFLSGFLTTPLKEDKIKDKSLEAIREDRMLKTRHNSKQIKVRQRDFFKPKKIGRGLNVSIGEAIRQYTKAFYENGLAQK